ncbi:histidine phosphatase family protein [Microbacterium sp. 2RAF4]|uniref:histidine phosphatase family protein n=1 Tax=Microbacterium sp. 2RAF4 TaxID=3232999 RepID=UPI003F98E03C
MTRVWLVRHGESLLNAAGRMQGWADAPLTPDGRAQAAARRQDFAADGLVFDAVVSADGIRHRETAGQLCPASTPREDAGWREVCFGALEGARSAALVRQLADHRDAPDPLRAVLTELSASAGGEHPDAVVARALAALGRAADDGDEVLVVTSGVTILLLLDALGADLDHVVAGPANLSVSTVDGRPGRWRVTRAVDQAM